MIGKIKGRVEHIFDDHCLLDVGGLCYIIYSSQMCLKKIVPLQDIAFFIHTIVRDDLPMLYGFEQYSERDLFVLLTSVQGVGGKVAISLIGDIGAVQIVQAIQQEQSQVLQQVSGIGIKIAKRVINELKNSKKLYQDFTIFNSTLPLKDDAISALINLGFKKSDVFFIVDAVLKSVTAETSLESVIKSCIFKLKSV